MRQIVLDTETTGFYIRDGNRILEIGCAEIVDRRPTGRNFHEYINPERDSEEGALRVHGHTTEFLSDKPLFADIADAFCEFIRGAEVIIHNAPFDLGFLNMEFERLGLPPFEEHAAKVTDSLTMARSLHPGKRNSLDALCERYGISNAHRTFHGALLDADLLVEVYLAMTRGQNTLSMEIETASDAGGNQIDLAALASEMIVLPASEEEIAAHEAVLDGIDKQSKGQTLWRKTEVDSQPN